MAPGVSCQLALAADGMPGVVCRDQLAGRQMSDLAFWALRRWQDPTIRRYAIAKIPDPGTVSLTLCKIIREATERVENVEKIEAGRTEQIFYSGTRQVPTRYRYEYCTPFARSVAG